jgi:hypothetical protein
LADAAYIGSKFLREPPDSGTANRSGVLAAFGRIMQNPVAQTAGLAGGAYAANNYGLATPGQLGLLGAALLANRAGLKVAASPMVIRGAPQKALAKGAQKVLPKVAVPYFLSQSAAAKEKKKTKNP